MYDFRKGWRLDLSHVINFACTQNLFLLRSCFPNTLVCFAALSSFGGVGGVILKAALVGVLGGIVVEFFLEGEMRLLKKRVHSYFFILISFFSLGLILISMCNLLSPLQKRHFFNISSDNLLANIAFHRRVFTESIKVEGPFISTIYIYTRNCALTLAFVYFCIYSSLGDSLWQNVRMTRRAGKVRRTRAPMT